jgi:hypothetical protein
MRLMLLHEVMWLMKSLNLCLNLKAKAKAKVKRLSTIISTSTSTSTSRLRLRLRLRDPQPQSHKDVRRIGNILTMNRLREYLRILVLLFFSKKALYGSKNSHFRTTFFLLSVWDRIFPGSLVPALVK